MATNELWVTDLTWAGVAYLCFIAEAYSSMIVGWRVAARPCTTMVLDALEMGRRSRGTHWLGCGVTATPGSRLRYGERLAEIGAVASIGIVGGSFDLALAETVNGCYKTELIRGPARLLAPGHGRGCRARHPPAGSTGTTPRRLHGYFRRPNICRVEEAFPGTKRTDQPFVEVR